MSSYLLTTLVLFACLLNAMFPTVMVMHSHYLSLLLERDTVTEGTCKIKHLIGILPTISKGEFITLRVRSIAAAGSHGTRAP